MGWTSPYDSQKDALTECLGPIVDGAITWSGTSTKDGAKMECRFDHLSFRPSGVWGRLETKKDGKVTSLVIGHFRTRRQDGGIAEGGLWDETCGPSADDCPITLLRLIPAPTEATVGKQSAEWAQGFRDRILAKNSTKKLGQQVFRSLVAGMVLKLPDTCRPNQLTVTAVAKKRVLATDVNGNLYRVTPAVAAKATISSIAIVV